MTQLEGIIVETILVFDMTEALKKKYSVFEFYAEKYLQH